MQKIGIFGMPRSGTTWLGKIFDSHPLTLLRHEPDSVTPTTEFPFIVVSDQIERHTAIARKYLENRGNDNYLRCVSNLPYFDKDYRNVVRKNLRQSLLFLGKSANMLTANRLERRLRIPDLCDQTAEYSTVIKSVDSVGRLALFARACQDFKFVFIIRHPCGVVSSKLRGQTQGKLKTSVAFKDWLSLDGAIRRGLTLKDLQDWDELETSAWGWKLLNEHVIEAVTQHPNVKILIYEELCDEPITISKELMDWSGLGWHAQCQSYIDECTETLPDQNSSYYSTVQNPQVASMKWRSELDAEQIRRIEEICRDSAPGDYFYDQK